MSPNPQRLAALEKANEVRYGRARMKREFRAGIRSPADVLRDPPAYADGMRIEDFLLSVPLLGARRVRAMLRRVSVKEHKTLGALTERQRAELVREIKERKWL